jgi:hypothetical protein
MDGNMIESIALSWAIMFADCSAVALAPSAALRVSEACQMMAPNVSVISKAVIPSGHVKNTCHHGGLDSPLFAFWVCSAVHIKEFTVMDSSLDCVHLMSYFLSNQDGNDSLKACVGVPHQG